MSEGVDVGGFVRLVLSFLMVLALTPLVAAPAHAQTPVDIYTVEGLHRANGREWRTRCEPYSRTKRCVTEIRATRIAQVGSNFVPTHDWVFNNLTYAAAPRALWSGNPLGGSGAVGGTVNWTSLDGRKWSTECDTPATGRNGCRSYVEATVIEPYLESTGRRGYQWVTKPVFNNLVRFS